jgi:hypothetical protein
MGNRKHRLRKGATSTNENDNVIIDRSQTVPIIRPVTTLKRSGSILSSRSRSSATSVRYGIFPDSNRSNTTTFLTPPSTSHSRHQRPSGQWTAERRSEDPRPKSSNAATSGSPNFLMGSASQPASPSRSESGLQTRKSRIMAVTEKKSRS